MALLLHYTGQDYINRGLAGGSLIPGSAASIVGGCKTGSGWNFTNSPNEQLELFPEFTYPDNFTISCWARPSNITELKNIYTNGGILNTGFVIDINNDRIRVFGYKTTGTLVLLQTIANSVSANTWYHITAGVSNERIFLYVNGEYINDTLFTNRSTHFEPLIGLRLAGSTHAFSGQICNFKYYNHALSKKEIAEDYKSLMLHYKLDKPITTQVFDHSGFNRHITNLTNTVTLDSKSQVYSASLKNNGTQRLMGDCDLTDLNGLDEGSFSFRVFLTANTGTGQYVIYNMTETISGNGITFVFRNAIVIAYFCGTRISFNYTPTVDVWHHIVLVKTSTQIKVYVDGVNVYTVSAATSSKNFSNITSISSTPKGYNPISDGNIQDIRFYATALTEQDVKDLYNVRHSIDKNGNYYTYELIEGQTGVGMKKNGQTNCDELIENEDGSFSIKSDKTIKVNNIKEI